MTRILSKMLIGILITCWDRCSGQTSSPLLGDSSPATVPLVWSPHYNTHACPYLALCILMNKSILPCDSASGFERVWLSMSPGSLQACRMASLGWVPDISIALGTAVVLQLRSELDPDLGLPWGMRVLTGASQGSTSLNSLPSQPPDLLSWDRA